MKPDSNHSKQEGAILAVVMVLMLAFSLITLSLFHLGNHSAREAAYEQRRSQAFWLAEAGVQVAIANLYAGGDGEISETEAGLSQSGSYVVIKDPLDETRRIATGKLIVGNRTITRRIIVELAYIASPFENAIYCGNYMSEEWTLFLNGKKIENEDDGPTMPKSGSSPGGNDVILGDLDINGNVKMMDDSKVMPPDPNHYGLAGDINASGKIDALDAAVSGNKNSNGSSAYDPPNLAAMEYDKKYDYDVAGEYEKYEALGLIVKGRLPESHALHDIVVKNIHPSGDPTPNADDYYFEPVHTVTGSRATGASPLILGDDKIYYVDGHVWFHNRSTYGFQVDGTAVIASTYDIHISDNINYKNRGSDAVSGNPPDMLALVALGQFTGDVRNGYGNVYFGDPKFGTLYSCDAFLFANNDFLYNTSSDTGGQEEPESGYKVFGNYMAVNNVIVLRDWYTKDGEKRPARYVLEDFDGDGSKEWDWVDALNYQDSIILKLSDAQKAGMRHYAMEVGYDDRIRSAGTQMRGLPLGNGKIFAGIKSWKEI